MSLSAHWGLASLTANYTDSEPEYDDVEEKEEVEKDESESKPPGDSVSPAGESNSRDVQSVSSAFESPSGGSRSKSNNRLGLVSYQDDLIDDHVVDDYYHYSDSLQDNAVERDDSSTALAEGGDTVRGVKPDLVDLEDISQEKEASDENELPEKPSKMPRIPSEPPLQCPADLQEKLTQLMGYNMNAIIQSNKQFRNPSIFEKLITRCRIDELGTNYPKHIYDPHIWGETSYYDELAKAQKTEMEWMEREKEGKDRTKVEFLSGTVKKTAPSSGSAGSSQPEEPKRKSKWDQKGVMPVFATSAC